MYYVWHDGNVKYVDVNFKREENFMKKKILIGVICLSMAVLNLGCGNNKEDTDTTVDSANVEDIMNDIASNDNESTDDQSSLVKLYKRNQVLSGYAIVTPFVQIILKADGTVFAKGENRFGQLGNGKRTDSQSWSKVENLPDDIISIYSLGSIGNEASNDNGYGHCYALSSSGKLYRWGGNILTPEAVFPDLTIKEINALTSNRLFIRCESGENYIIVARPGLYADDSVFSYNSLGNDMKLYGSPQNGFFIYDNSNLSYVALSSLNYTESIDEISPIEDKIKATIPIDISEKIKNIIPCVYNGFGGAILITNTGSIIGIEYDDNTGEINIEDKGGSGIKKASFDTTIFELFENGKLTSCGENEYGQLGDGTNISYDDGFLEIGDQETIFNDYEYYGWPYFYTIALDRYYNIWGWGKGFNSLPSIIIEKTDFISD